jgi:hypothetical protein
MDGSELAEVSRKNGPFHSTPVFETHPVSNPSEGGSNFAKASTVTRTPKNVSHVTVQMMTTVSNAATTKTTIS